MYLKDLIKDLAYKKVYGSDDIEIVGISEDSREIKPGYLFVSIRGYKTDGRNFIKEALQKGARAIVVETDFDFSSFLENTTTVLIKVNKARETLSFLANKFYEGPSMKLTVIGITGTNGKTTTTFMTEAILAAANFKTGIISTVLYQINELKEKPIYTTPRPIKLHSLFSEMAKRKFDFAVMEVSSHSLALERVEDVDFNVATFMNLTQDHLDFHQNFSDYLEAKLKLFKLLDKSKKSPKVAIINIDDSSAPYLIKNISSPIITFGIEKDAEVKATEIKMNLYFSSFKLITKKEEKNVELNLTGKFNVYNALAAIAIGKACNVDIEIIIQALKNFSPPPGRFEKIHFPHGFIVIIDYAHTPDGLENLLTTVKNLVKGKVITVFGCGGNRDRTKRPLMGEIAAKLSDYLIITNDNPRLEEPLRIIMDIEIGINKVMNSKGGYQKISDRAQAIKEAIKLAQKDDVVIIAGKGHEDSQIIGENVFHFNDKEEVEKILKTME